MLEVDEDALERLAVLVCERHHVDALNHSKVGLLDCIPNALAANVSKHVGDAERGLTRSKLRKIEGLRHNFYSVIMAQGSLSFL